MRRARLLGALLSVLLISTAATSCGGGGSGDEASGVDDNQTTGDDGGDPAELADRDGELRFAISFGFNSFDPHRSPLAQGDQVFLRPVYDTLLEVVSGPDGPELGPQLATSFDISDDGLSIDLELRDDVSFQDGTPFDATAAKANLERAMDAESTVASILSSVEDIEVVDDTHLTYHLSQPDPSIPWSMAVGTTGMMLSPAAFDNDDLASNPVGSGPFQLVSAAKDADIVYERWDEHWDPDAALVAKLTVTTFTDGNVRFNSTRAGEYDAAFLSTPQDFEAKSLTAEGYSWEQRLSPNVYGILLHTGRAPFDDVRVRRAVSMALNRTEIAEALLNGINPPVYQVFAEGSFAHDPALDEDPYDPEAARALVEEAGATGAEITVVQSQTSPQDSLAQVVQAALADIGLEVELVPLSPTEARPAWRTGNYDANVTPIIGQAEPSSTLNLSYLDGDDNPGGAPADLAEMADEALVLPFGSEERAEAYREISAHLVENPIHVPIVQFSTVILASPEVVGSDRLMTSGIANLNFRGVGVTG